MYDWKPVTVAIRITGEGPKCYKTYTRGGKTFWRNYRRDVRGGVSFIQRVADESARQLARAREYISTEIFSCR